MPLAGRCCNVPLLSMDKARGEDMQHKYFYNHAPHALVLMSLINNESTLLEGRKVFGLQSTAEIHPLFTGAE